MQRAQTLLNTAVVLCVLVLCVALTLSPLYIASLRWNGPFPLFAGGSAVMLLLVALISQRPLHDPLFWSAGLVGWIASVRLQGDGASAWAAIWIVALMAACGARMWLELLDNDCVREAPAETIGAKR